MNNWKTSYFTGLLVIAILSGLFLFLKLIANINFNSWDLWVPIVIGSFITAYISNNEKVIRALYLAIPCAIIVGAHNYIWQLFGNTSYFQGFNGLWYGIVISLPLAVILSGTGGLAGKLLSHNNTLKFVLRTGPRKKRAAP